MVPIAASDLTDEDKAFIAKIADIRERAQTLTNNADLAEENLSLRLQLRKIDALAKAKAAESAKPDADLPKAAEGTE